MGPGSLRRVYYFVTVAEQKSITAAARVLHMAQPPLSTQIRELERELGAPLFRREGRRVTLTAAGAAILPEARRLIERYEVIGPLARRAQAGESGRLSIGFVPSAANGQLPRAVRAFRTAYPDVEVSLTEGRPADLRDQLAHGDVDICLVYGRVVDDGVGTRQLAAEKLVLAVAAEHQLAGRVRVRVEALRTQPLILPAAHGSDGLYEHITRVLVEHDVRPIVVAGDIWMMQTIIGLVSAGLGVAVVPESAAVIRAGAVHYCSLVGAGAPVPLTAVWSDDRDATTVHTFLRTWAGLQSAR